MAELQTIPARHGTATFVPAGHVIKIINSSGSQVVDTWAFALPNPAPKKEDAQAEEGESKKEEPPKKPEATPNAKAQPKAKKKGMNLPSQEDAEKATQQAAQEGEGEGEGEAKATQQKSTWSSYVPTSYVPTKVWPSFGKDGKKGEQQSEETEQQKNSRTWASYFPSGKGFTSYIPQTATDSVSAFAAAHQRDPNKSYMEQLQGLSKTPVGAAGWSGLAALTGSGWSGSTLAGYQAWNAQNAAHAPPMEFMSMSHSRTATLHLRPRVNDTLVTNLREPILTLVEDSAGGEGEGVHDTLIAACDPARYKGLGVEKWQEHGSCAENLVLALEELNKRAGLKGAKAVGADITINTVPAPLNLFMNIPWDSSGELGFHPPKAKKNDYVRFKAERDIVVVMSACPQDILEINNKEPSDAHFVVEGDEEPGEAIKRTQQHQAKKRPPPRKVESSHATSTVASQNGGPTPAPAAKRAPAPKKTVSKTAAKGTSATGAASSQAQAGEVKAAAAPAKKKPVPPPVTAQKKTAASPTTGTNATSKSTAPASSGGAKSSDNLTTTSAPTSEAKADESTPAQAPAPQKRKPRKLNPKPAS